VTDSHIEDSRIHYPPEPPPDHLIEVVAWVEPIYEDEPCYKSNHRAGTCTDRWADMKPMRHTAEDRVEVRVCWCGFAWRLV